MPIISDKLQSLKIISQFTTHIIYLAYYTLGAKIVLDNIRL
jgi:hypothetical protein